MGSWVMPRRCTDPPPTPRVRSARFRHMVHNERNAGPGTTLCGIQVTSDALWASVAGDERIGTRVSGPSCASDHPRVVSLGWKPRRSRRTAGSPHPCGIYGWARPARMLDSTALGCRSLIRMRPLVQVQPGPQIGPVTSGNAGHCVRSASPMSCIPFGDEVFRVLPLLSRNNASEQPLSGPTAVVCLRSSVAQRCQNPSLCLGPSVGLQARR
jgi:hypothetical protein